MKEIQSDYGVYCDKCGTRVYVVSLRDAGTRGVRCLCVNCNHTKPGSQAGQREVKEMKSRDLFDRYEDLGLTGNEDCDQVIESAR